MDEYETMLRTVPTTEDGGDFVLFEDRERSRPPRKGRHISGSII